MHVCIIYTYQCLWDFDASSLTDCSCCSWLVGLINWICPYMRRLTQSNKNCTLSWRLSVMRSYNISIFYKLKESHNTLFWCSHVIKIWDLLSTFPFNLFSLFFVHLGKGLQFVCSASEGGAPLGFSQST